MFRIVESEFIKSAVLPKDYPSSMNYDIAFVGKSNVGKSSMINTILNRKAIAKISSTPGKTRLINFFDIRFKVDVTAESGQVNFVDLPGYGYAKVSKKERDSWRKMVEAYFSHRRQIKGVVVLIDIRHKADPKDLIMIEMLRSQNISFILTATKADKIPKSRINATLTQLALQFSVEKDKIIAFSSLKKTGKIALLNWIHGKIS